ncbi:hypothetical protein SAMN05443661_1449 [Natronobacterium gregoryi]|uniref:Uncharacterized protein n=3 Tax=Natronobacterium gregoryi TaxID=44930 RepID=L0AJ07_NATGS|nr:hypothetical protein Natgr_2743 [Natronobacterium gregoryi SP2]ELY64844.1 hypothetical protein C490_14200 [Natronobacterium gregoryi SP2]PLK19154.1 hypothetical protein CYV19_16405 [Natronobacterium gregoryi SP2]SFJ59511.1 hypothetical protein SAMN05443661_1449 [Natronobacterium gregoryi]
MLRLTGATAVAAVGTAGCLGTVGLTDDGAPSYSPWLGHTGDQGLFYASVDWAAFERFDDLAEEFESAADDPSETPADRDDPMLALPTVGVVAVGFGASLTLLGTGLGDLVTFDGEREFETAVDEITIVNDVLVLAGDIDRDEIDEVLTAASADDPDTNTAYEQTTEIAGFDVYEPLEEDGLDFSLTDEKTVAVGDDAVLLAPNSEGDGIDRLRGPIEAYADDGQPYADTNDDLEWLLSTAGSGHVAIGSYGITDRESESDRDLEHDVDETGTPLDDAAGVVASLTIEGESQASVELAATFDELDTDAEATLESRLGSSAAEIEYEVDDDRLTASGTWDEDVTET